MASYFDYREQTVHDFDRPHEAVPDALGAVPGEWRGPAIATSPKWRTVLSPDAIDELDAALRTAEPGGKPTEALTAADVPLPGLANEIACWRWLSNHVVLHARTGYEDDPEHPRHLLRLWLSLDR